MSPDPNKRLHEGFKSWFTGKKPESPDPGNPFLAVTTEPFRGIDYEDVVEHFFPNADEKFRKKFTGALGLIKLLDKPFVKRFVEDMGPGIEKGGYRYKTIVYFLNRLMEKGKDLYSKPENYKDNPIIMKGLQDPDSDIFIFLKEFGWLGESPGDAGAGEGGPGGDDPAAETGGAGEPGGGAGAKFATPVFKKYSGKDQEAGAPQGSLASQLMKQFPDVDKSVLTQILKDVVAQLKANNVEIQENKKVFVKTLTVELLGVQSRLLVEKNRFINIEPGGGVRLKPDMDQAKLLALFPGKEGKAQELFDILSTKIKGAQDTEAIERAQRLASALGQGAAKNVRSATKKLIAALKNARSGGPETTVDDSGADIEVDDSDIIEENPIEKLHQAFTRAIKKLDLDSSAGRQAALNVDQSLLGAYRIYTAMMTFRKSPLNNMAPGEPDYEKLLKKIEPLNERTDPVKTLLMYIDMMVADFKTDGLDFDKKSMPAELRQRLKGLFRDKADLKDPTDITEPYTKYDGTKETPEEVVTRVAKFVEKGRATKQDLIKAQEKAKASGAGADRDTGKAGTVNVRQSIGPRLKAAGIDLKSPEGHKIQTKMLKHLNWFLRTNLKRMGKDITIIAESAELQRKILNNLREILIVRGLSKK